MLGRKRHLLVDTLGHVLEADVGPASEGDRASAKRLLVGIRGRFPRLRRIWVGLGYAGADFLREVAGETGVTLEVVAKEPGRGLGFEVLPKRWIVERTHAWNGRERRVVRDLDHDAASSRAWLLLASIRRLVKRLAPSADQIHRRFDHDPTQLALC